jgi:nitrogenase molybdenum-iron protein alpha/beta subunit
MQLNLKNNTDLQAAVISRLTRELGETYAANCTLDLVSDALLAELNELKAANAALVEGRTKDRELIRTLREQLGTTESE